MPSIDRQSTVRCHTCGYLGQVLVAHHGNKLWMLPAGFLIACRGIELIPLAVVLILMGNRSYEACPSCKGRQVAGWMCEPDQQSQRIYAEAKEADDTKFKQNKLILLAVVMVMFAAALVFMFYMMQNP